METAHIDAKIDAEDFSAPGTTPASHLVRHNTVPESNPFDEVEWEVRNCVISNERGEVIQKIEGVQVPKRWSHLASDIALSKYIRRAGVPETGQETSVRQLIHRVAHTIRTFGEQYGDYFINAAEAETFETELTHLLLHQKAAFNSPVWFNCGLYHEYGITGSGGNYAWDFQAQAIRPVQHNYQRPQCSACFIQSVEDDLESIFELSKNEARLFKYGSGTGTNFSALRSKYERLSGGGTSSGLMSFLEVLDRGAGATKSGGTTRRAAKMVILDVDHPEITDFANWKVKEEKKVAALVNAGYPADFNGEAYHTVAGQNSNNSVRVTDAFMQAVLNDSSWETTYRTSGEVHETLQARQLWNSIARAAWQCADPGVQFDTTINDWHTCRATERIYASNPCSEYMFLNDSACNLASINLLRFLDADGRFDVEGYRHAIGVLITAMEIVVDLASYPTERIAGNSHDYRPLGLGYANLGALLMSLGIPYDSPEALAWVSSLTALLTGQAYVTSTLLASRVEPFPAYAPNRDSMLEVMDQHRRASLRIDGRLCQTSLVEAAQNAWDEVLKLGRKHGFRNAQTTVLAPTGTIGLLMDCDTLGIEPDFSLVKYKKLAGGGNFKIVNHSVPKALERLGYTPDQIKDIITYLLGTGKFGEDLDLGVNNLIRAGLTAEDVLELEAQLAGAYSLAQLFSVSNLGPQRLARLGVTEDDVDSVNIMEDRLELTKDQIRGAELRLLGHQTLEGAPHLLPEHLPIFDCASKCGALGQRYIKPMGHMRIMAAAQPFISGAISKTVNVPKEATWEQVEQLYMEAWRMGLKAISIYRDGSKLSQPLSSTTGEVEEDELARPLAFRRHLPDERISLTHKFSINQHEGYITVGLFDDGSPGELFIRMSKEGSTISGLMDTIATATSIMLQYGVPLEVLVNKFSHSRFEPAGYTNNKQIPIAKSIIDYIFRWMKHKYLDEPLHPRLPLGDTSLDDFIEQEEKAQASSEELARFASFEDSPACHNCGSIMIRNGSCYLCRTCGETSGCS